MSTMDVFCICKVFDCLYGNKYVFDFDLVLEPGGLPVVTTHDITDLGDHSSGNSLALVCTKSLAKPMVTCCELEPEE